ncbi:MAG: methyltransferase domain-containing protein [Nitrospira sp.]|nr:methyltransferase domain-containing protein [Nitrospira sp.]
MHTKTYLLALCLLVVPNAVGQAAEHGQSHADHMEKHFDAEESAPRFDDPARDAWQLPDQVIATLNLKRGQSVADIGAGTGYFTVRLAKSNASPKVYASDIEPSMVMYLRERAAKESLDNVMVIQASPDGPNLPEPVDLILIVNTYHHIGDRETYFRKLATSLKAGGQVAIIDFKPDSPVGPPKEFRFLPELFQAEMGKAGYKLTRRHHFLPRQEFFVFEVAGRPSP